MKGMELPASWEFAPLGDLLVGIESGKSFKCEERPPGIEEIGVAKVSAVTWGRYQESESKTCLDVNRVNQGIFVKPNDFLFSRANTIDLVGACVIAKEVRLRVMLSDKILRFNFAQEGMKPWVLHFLRSRHGRSQIERLSSGNQESMRNIGQERVAQIKIPLPPSGEQARVLAKLEEIFSGLDSAENELKTAKKKLALYRQSLLKAAVEGRVTAEWRQKNAVQSTAGDLLSHILDERRSCWEEQQLAKYEEQGKEPPKNWRKGYPESLVVDNGKLPLLPQGWIWATVDQLSPDDLANGRSVPTANSGAKVLRLTSVRNGSIDLSATKCGAWTEGEAKPFAVAEGDLLIVRGNGSLSLVGRAGLVGKVAAQIAYPDTLIRLRVLRSVVRPAWVGLVWGSLQTRAHLESRARTSAGIYKISQPDIVSVAVPVPPLAEQDQILAEFEIATQRILAVESSLEAALKQAAAQRQNILRAAFCGQLVPQDPNDEPASRLLERIRAERAAAPKKATRGRKGARAAEVGQEAG